LADKRETGGQHDAMRHGKKPIGAAGLSLLIVGEQAGRKGSLPLWG